MKKGRTLFLDDADWKKFCEKAKEYFQGKGYKERFIEKIANTNFIFIEGTGKFEIKPI